MTLKRLLGPYTALLIGLGIAIGSGIFRTPGLVAERLAATLPGPGWILAVWVAGGVFVLVSGLVSAELATRFPQAGGEYAYLRAAYGETVAFVFGWGYTIFINGGGAATIAMAAGEAAAELWGLPHSASPLLATVSIALVVGINALGLVAGAGFQNVLTAIKVAAVAGVAGFGLYVGGAPPWPQMVAAPTISPWTAFLAAVVPALWAYEGTTDAVKLAEEVKDVRRALPRALVGSALLLTALYVLVNAAYLAVLGPNLAGARFPANDVMAALFGAQGRAAMLVLSLVVLLGALSSTVLATVRVTFALARDRLAPQPLAWMSKGQAPVPALLTVGAVAMVFCAARNLEGILSIYFLAATALFGASYGSLWVFRWRDRGQFPATAFRCPAGPWLAALLISFQLAVAFDLAKNAPLDALGTVGLLVGLVVLHRISKYRSAGRTT